MIDRDVAEVLSSEVAFDAVPGMLRTGIETHRRTLLMMVRKKKIGLNANIVGLQIYHDICCGMLAKAKANWDLGYS